MLVADLAFKMFVLEKVINRARDHSMGEINIDLDSSVLGAIVTSVRVVRVNKIGEEVVDSPLQMNLAELLGEVSGRGHPPELRDFGRLRGRDFVNMLGVTSPELFHVLKVCVDGQLERLGDSFFFCPLQVSAFSKYISPGSAITVFNSVPPFA